MSARSVVKIVNLQFVPDLIELPLGGEIEIRVMSHADTALYSSSQRKFIINCSEFETPELFPGDSFRWKFRIPGNFILLCPLYSWMKARIFITASENPQDPDAFLHKPLIKTQTKTVTPQVTVKHHKKNLELPSISSSVGSEDEIGGVLSKNEEIDREIENLFLRVKEECERDQVKPANFLKEIEEDTVYETREKVTRNKDVVNVEREENKGKVHFITRTMAPSRYFSEYKEERLAVKTSQMKSKKKIKRKEKEFRRRIRKDKVLAEKLFKLIVDIKINRNQQKEWQAKTSKSEQKLLIIERKCKELQKVREK